MPTHEEIPGGTRARAHADALVSLTTARVSGWSRSARRSRATQAADDLAQETLIEAWRNLHKLDDRDGADRWLNAIARNAACTGLTSVFSSVGVETLVQRGVPDVYRGRVYGALGASGSLLSLLGAATAGIFAEVVGVVVMLSVAAVLIMLAGVAVLWAFAGDREPPAAAVVDAGKAQAAANEARTDVKNASPSVPGPHKDSTACSG